MRLGTTSLRLELESKDLSGAAEKIRTPAAAGAVLHTLGLGGPWSDG